MSNLLERMVRRTRAPLAGIEPLVEPRYARANQRLRVDMFNESKDASSSFDGMAEGPSETQPITHTQSGPSEHDRCAPETPASVRRIFEAAPAITTDADIADKPRTHTLETRLLNSFSDHPAPKQHQAKRPSSIAGMATLAGPVSPSLISPPAIMAGSTPQSHSTSGYVTATQRRQEGQTREPSSPQQKLAADTGMEPANEAASIAITIGHIEVRAAQTAERSRRPAFRPRVTLDDFLSRQNRTRP